MSELDNILIDQLTDVSFGLIEEIKALNYAESRIHIITLCIQAIIANHALIIAAVKNAGFSIDAVDKAELYYSNLQRILKDKLSYDKFVGFYTDKDFLKKEQKQKIVKYLQENIQL